MEAAPGGASEMQVQLGPLSNDDEASVGDSTLCASQDAAVEPRDDFGSWLETEPDKVPEDSFDLFGGAGSSRSPAKSLEDSYDLFGGAGSSGYGDRSASPSSVVPVDVGPEAPPPSRHSGLVGLSNLGNTCFMASMLQCLASIRDLRVYFTSGAYSQEINTTNAFSTKGALAHAYADLMTLMWHGQSAVVSPRGFKTVLGRFAPQFLGFSQHDSQELCNFVLDALSEDLNRVAVQPYVPNYESDGTEPDTEVARQVLDRHRRRYDSHVAHLFEGLFKSQVSCPTCETVSVTFDPYMSVAVPLGAAGMRVVHATLRRSDGAMQPLALECRRDATVGALLAAAAAQRGLSVETLVACEVVQHKLHKIFTLDHAIERLYDGDFVFLYEAPNAADFDGRGGHKAAGGGRGGGSDSEREEHAPAVATADDTAGGPTAASVPASVPTVPLVVVQMSPEASAAGCSDHTGLPMLLAVPVRATGAELHRIVRAELRRYEVPQEGGGEAGEGTGGGPAGAPAGAPALPGYPVADASGMGESGMEPSVIGPSGVCASGVGGASGTGTAGTHATGADACATAVSGEDSMGGVDSCTGVASGDMCVVDASSVDASSAGWVSGLDSPGAAFCSVDAPGGWSDAPGHVLDASLPRGPESEGALGVGGSECEAHGGISMDRMQAGGGGHGAGRGEGEAHDGSRMDEMHAAVVGRDNEKRSSEAHDDSSMNGIQAGEQRRETGRGDSEAHGGSSMDVSRTSSSDVSVTDGEGRGDGDGGDGRSGDGCPGGWAEPQWELRWTDSSYFVASPDGLGPRVQDDDAPALSSGGGGPLYLVLVWRAAAFGRGGGYSRERLDADSAAATAQPCRKSRPHAGGVTLHDCLDQFAREEVLDTDNAWYCPRCKTHRQGRKKLQIWSLPPVLVIHLIRFSNESAGRWRRKVDTLVDFPTRDLNLSRHCLSAAPGSAVYDLRAISNHFGGTSSGHYTAFARHSETGAWHEFNDSSVSAADESSVCTAGAYVLIYERRGAQEGGEVIAAPAVHVQAEEAMSDTEADPLAYLM